MVDVPPDVDVVSLVGTEGGGEVSFLGSSDRPKRLLKKPDAVLEDVALVLFADDDDEDEDEEEAFLGVSGGGIEELEEEADGCEKMGKMRLESV